MFAYENISPGMSTSLHAWWLLHHVYTENSDLHVGSHLPHRSVIPVDPGSTRITDYVYTINISGV